MKSIPSISELLPNYDAFLLDLWGVVHDGSQLYDGVHNTLLTLKKNDKKTVFISNAPRRIARVRAVLENLGIDDSLYADIASSGEVGYQRLQEGRDVSGKKYYLIAEEKDLGLLAGLDYEQVNDIADADFILNLGFGSHDETPESFTEVFTQSIAAKTPMLCLNPDIEVIKITGERFLCAGALAKNYLTMGGQVKYFGKPHIEIYEYAHRLLGDIPKHKILAVGDSLETDIPGANNFGVDSLLITGGILKGKTIEQITAECDKPALKPTFVTDGFGTR